MSKNKADIIIDLVSETREDIKELKKESAKQSSDINQNRITLISSIKKLDILEEELALHKKDVEGRLESVETPKKVRVAVYNFLLKLGAIVGVLFSILKLIEYFKII